jgi:hypothetical protein
MCKRTADTLFSTTIKIYLDQLEVVRGFFEAIDVERHLSVFDLHLSSTNWKGKHVSMSQLLKKIKPVLLHYIA